MKRNETTTKRQCRYTNDKNKTTILFKKSTGGGGGFESIPQVSNYTQINL